VLDDIRRVLPGHLELATVATVSGVVLHPGRSDRRHRRGSWIDHAFRLLGLAGYSVPVFWRG
jgi:peptide/nickel transport system permease protein